MKRKTSKTPSKIWTFGCLTPDRATREKLLGMIRDAHKYYNRRVEIERDRRARASAAVQGLSKGDRERADAELKARMEAACEEAGYVRTSSGGFPPRAVSAVKGGVLEDMLREPDWPDEWKDLASVNEEAARKVKEARRESGLPPGTYLLVEKAFEAACRPVKNALRKKNPGKPKARPAFKRWDGSGRVGAQVRREPAADVLSGTAPSVKLLPRGDDLRRGAVPREDRMEVQLRTGPGKEAVRLACVVHRMPPEGAVVTGAWIRIRKVGPRHRYDLQLVLEDGSFKGLPKEGPAAAVDLGWRKMEDGSVRTAYWADELGREGEVRVPAVVLTGLEHCSRLESARDGHHNRALALARIWIRGVRPFLPEDLRRRTESMRSWRSPSRLAGLAWALVKEYGLEGPVRAAWKAWKDDRLSQGEDLFASYGTVRAWARREGIGTHPMILFLDFWRRKNRHLFLWSEAQRKKVLGHRDEVFKIEASRMASEYGEIVFENFDLRGFARDAMPGEDPEPDRHHRVRNAASPGRFRAFVLAAAGDGRVLDEEMMNSTRECHSCGHVNAGWTKPWKLNQTCGGCGAEWDQDRNAALVLLKRRRERLDGASPPVGARKPTRPRKKLPTAHGPSTGATP